MPTCQPAQPEPELVEPAGAEPSEGVKTPEQLSLGLMKRARCEGNRAGSGPPSSQGCAVCLEPFGVDGSHQAASLKCGHVTGLSCLTRWLVSMRKASCPTCHVKATKRDIRPIFVPAAAAMVDTGQEQQLRRDLDVERKERTRLERILARQSVSGAVSGAAVTCASTPVAVTVAETSPAPEAARVPVTEPPLGKRSDSDSDSDADADDVDVNVDSEEATRRHLTRRHLREVRGCATPTTTSRRDSTRREAWWPCSRGAAGAAPGLQGLLGLALPGSRESPCSTGARASRRPQASCSLPAPTASRWSTCRAGR